jgi:hypothetical protein
MKRLFKIFELSKNEQPVILIVMLVLVVIAFVGYQWRVHRSHPHAPGLIDAKASPTPVQAEKNT